jgi:mRNA guanylyltransferase
MGNYGAEFVADVVKQDFDRFQNQFDSWSRLGAGFKNTKSKQTAYTYADRRRVVHDHDTNTLHKQTKTTLGNKTFYLGPNCAYDLRVAVALETEMVKVDAIDAGHTGTRLKERQSFAVDGWQLDLTKVTSKDAGATAGETVHEVEVELGVEKTQEWLRNDETAKVVAGDSVAKLLKVLRCMLDNSRYKIPCVVVVGKGPSSAMALAAKQCWQNCMPPEQSNMQRFPGTMPAAFKRKNIKQVMATDWMISEKTDGVRYFMVITETQNKQRVVLLVDREGTAFSMPGLQRLAEVIRVGTVIDGEVVLHRSKNKLVFIAFDLLGIGGNSVMHEPFVKRLQVLQQIVGFYDSKRAQFGMGVIDMFMKKWTKKSDICSIFSNIKLENGLGEPRTYNYKGTRTNMHHYTDGIIFAPMGPYIIGSAGDRYLKWKWGDLVTVDFKVQINNEGMKFFAGGDSGDDIDFTRSVSMEEDEREKLTQALRQNARGAVVTKGVAELGLEPTTGMWQYKLLRPDKKQGNHYTVVVDTLMQLAQDISQEELQYCMLKGQGAHWRQKIQEAKVGLLQSAKTSR